MTNRNRIDSILAPIHSAAILAYCDQFNSTAELLPDDAPITPADCISTIRPLDNDDAEYANAFAIDITNDDCAITILAMRTTITNDRFATNDETLKFFLSADECAYIPLP